jgi:hypothetical protein
MPTRAYFTIRTQILITGCGEVRTGRLGKRPELLTLFSSKSLAFYAIQLALESCRRLDWCGCSVLSEHICSLGRICPVLCFQHNPQRASNLW